MTAKLNARAAFWKESTTKVGFEPELMFTPLRLSKPFYPKE
jgi:hypothetical protein